MKSNEKKGYFFLDFSIFNFFWIFGGFYIFFLIFDFFFIKKKMELLEKGKFFSFGFA